MTCKGTIVTGEGMVGCSTEGFEGWYRDEHPRLVAVLAVECGDVEVARDAASEAFARALERWERVGAMASPSAWTYKVALNFVRRRKRRAGLERVTLRRQAPPAPVPPADLSPELWAAVRALPNRQRRAVALRYMADLTEPRIAEVMDVAPGTVAATLHAARRTLAVRLGDPTPEETRHG